MPVKVERYPNSRFWAVWEGSSLLCVTVYKKGAINVANRLTAALAGHSATPEATAAQSFSLVCHRLDHAIALADGKPAA